MTKRALVFLLPIFLGCGSSSISSGQFEDPGADGATTDETGATEDGASEGSTEDSGTSATDSSTTGDSTESDTGEPPPPMDSMVPPTDGPEPPLDSTTPPVDAPVPGCSEPGGALFGGHCYFPIAMRQWTVARDFCVSRGAHLATITSKAEQDFLSAFGGTSDRWIGLSRPEGTPYAASSYKWVTPEAVGYTNWSAGEPNFSGTAVRLKNDGTWADQPGNNSILGICEREP